MEIYIGMIVPFGGNYIPPYFLPCNGQQFLTTQYQALFAVIGYNYGGSGSNFNVPDLRGALVIGSQQLGASAAGAPLQAPFAITQAMTGPTPPTADGDTTGTVVGAAASQGFTVTPKMVPVTWMICCTGLFPQRQ